MTILEADPFPGEDLEPSWCTEDLDDVTVSNELDVFLQTTGNPEVRQHMPILRASGAYAVRECLFTD